MRRRLGVVGVLAIATLSQHVRGAETAVEIVRAKVDRFALAPRLLSPDWFFLDQRRVGKIYLNVPAGTDINEWLDSFKGKSMKLLVFPGRDYEVRPSERALRDTMEYSWSPEDFGHNFFVGNIDLVVQNNPDDEGRFVEQKHLADKLKTFVGQEVVLILRPD